MDIDARPESIVKALETFHSKNTVCPDCGKEMSGLLDFLAHSTEFVTLLARSPWEYFQADYVPEEGDSAEYPHLKVLHLVKWTWWSQGEELICPKKAYDILRVVDTRMSPAVVLGRRRTEGYSDP